MTFPTLPTWPNEGPTFTALDVEPFFVWCAKLKISDITIQSDQPIIVEKDGRFHSVTKRLLSPNEVEDVLVKLYDGEVAKGLIQKTRDIDCAYEAKPTRGELYRFRINATAVYGGIQITARTIQDQPPRIEDLKVEPEIIQNIAPKNGLILVTGATGSGKTTLLAGIIRYLLELPDGHRKIITYESPIEFVYTKVERGASPIPGQTEIGEGRMLKDWNEAIRNALRRAPDVILLGEARDAETLAGTIEACQTGHLVYTTVHTSGFVETIPRMISQFPPASKNARATDIISALQMVISQMLVPTVDGKRVALREYVIFNDEIVNMLLNYKGGIDNIQMACREVLKKYGRSFIQDAREKFEQGIISEAEFKEVARKMDAEDRDSVLSESRNVRDTNAQILVEKEKNDASEKQSGGMFDDLLRNNEG